MRTLYPSRCLHIFFLILNKYLPKTLCTGSILYVEQVYFLFNMPILNIWGGLSCLFESFFLQGKHIQLIHLFIHSHYFISWLLCPCSLQWHHNILSCNNWDWLLLVYSLQWWLMTYRLLYCWTLQFVTGIRNQRYGTGAFFYPVRYHSFCASLEPWNTNGNFKVRPSGLLNRFISIRTNSFRVWDERLFKVLFSKFDHAYEPLESF